MITGLSLKAEILVRYDIGDIEECVLLARGINDSYLVVARGRPQVLRLYRADWRELEQIEAEVRLLTRFARAELPVSVPMADRDGNFVQSVSAPEGMRYAVLFSYAEGRPLNRESSRDLALLGRFAAELHLATASIPIEPSRPSLTVEYLLQRPITRLRPYLLQWPEALDYIAQLANDLATLLEPFANSLTSRRLCHGDLNTRNVHLSQSARLTVFDFDLCAYGSQSYEFASVLRDIGGFNSAWDAFLKAYSAVEVLSADEERAIPIFLPVRAIWELGLQAELIGDGGFNRLMGLIDFELPRLKEWSREHLGL